MGIGDMLPSGGNHGKKPMTRAELRKIQESYQHGEMIAEHVKLLEAQEQEKTTNEAESALRFISL